jgi:Septin
MAPATVESASPIGIANVSLDFMQLDHEAYISSLATQPTVCLLYTSPRWAWLIDQMWCRHKIVAKRGAAFTIMVRTPPLVAIAGRWMLMSFQVAGESGLGKTTFINTLFSTTIKNYADHKRRHAKQVDKTVEIEITKAELEEKFFKGTFLSSLSSSRFCKPDFISATHRDRHPWLR